MCFHRYRLSFLNPSLRGPIANFIVKTIINAIQTNKYGLRDLIAGLVNDPR